MRIYTPNGWEDIDETVTGNVFTDASAHMDIRDGRTYWIFRPTPSTGPDKGVQTPKSTLTREEALYDARKVLGDNVRATLLSDNMCRMELNGSINDAPDWELALKGLQSLLKKENKCG